MSDMDDWEDHYNVAIAQVRTLLEAIRAHELARIGDHETAISPEDETLWILRRRMDATRD